MDPDYPGYFNSIHHDGSRRYVRLAHGGEPRLGDEVTIRLRTLPDAPVEQVLLRICPDGEQQFIAMLPEAPGAGQAACQWWQCRLRLSMPLTGYRFLLITQDGAIWYNGAGVQRHLPTDSADFRILAGYEAPAWVRASVFYQIFPDRFADGDPANNVRDGEFLSGGHPATSRRWGEPPTAGGRAAMVEFFGGDLAGIEQRLDYIADLGANAIYLNPVFPALSNHRYDVTDYFHVDPHLGGEPGLVSLRAATASRGMRLMLDIVPNHCGVQHPWFQAAQADPAAPSAEFFTFNRHPDDYACWLGVRGLPKLNYRSATLQEVIYAGPQAVFRHWLRPPYTIDGWRVDVANMLARQGADQMGVEIGRGIRQAVKEENPQAYLLGENFFDASPQLQGDMWDASMNYSGFAKPVWFWLKGFEVNQHGHPPRVASAVPWTAQELATSWQTFRAVIPWAIASQQFNLLGSHDTPRILSIVKGSPALNRVAVGLLFTYIGVPSVYYGDEIGLAGEGSAVRACMPWDPAKWDGELLGFYKTLIGLRRESPALADGGFQVLAAAGDTLAYLRDVDEEQIIVVARRSASRPEDARLAVAPAALPDGAELEELFSGRRAVVSAGYLPLSGAEAGIEIWRWRA